MGGGSEETVVVEILKKGLKALEIHGEEGREIFKSTLAPRGLAIHSRKFMPEGKDRKEISYEDFPDGFAGRIPWDDYENNLVEGLDGEPTVLIDRDVAMLWAPYWFTVNGALTHVGTDIVTMVKRDWDGKDVEQWLIVSITDNARSPSDEDKKKHEARSRTSARDTS